MGKRRLLARREEPQALADREVEKLIGRARAEGDEGLALLIRTLYETGARVSEALALRPADIIAAEGGAWAVLPNLKRRLKAGEKPPVKRCAITAGLAAELLGYAGARGIGPDRPIFASPKDPARPLSRQYIWRRLKALCEAEGIRRINRDGRLVAAWPHTLRHGAAVRLVLAGLPAPVVQAQLGHASLATTQRYFELSEETRLRLIVGALAAPGEGEV